MRKEITKFIFIINPSSGNQKLRDWENIISKYLFGVAYEILYTEYSGHGNSLLSNYQGDENTCIVAVGGDGTVNELLNSIYQSKTCLGIIPTGSGNGLARHLKIPLKIEKAIQKLTQEKPRSIDLFKLNNHYCINTCGIGFTALVTKHFGIKGERGFRTYFKLALKLYKTSKTFEFKLNDQLFQDVWMVEFANSSQLGNNVYVSPAASVTDGIADILIVRKPKPWQVPSFIAMALSGNILKSRLSKLIKAQEVKVTLSESHDYHIDGEYMGTLQEATLQILPSALEIIH
jgi:YegS/Rv2252/BmrU family lipid kinase